MHQMIFHLLLQILHLPPTPPTCCPAQSPGRLPWVDGGNRYPHPQAASWVQPMGVASQEDRADGAFISQLPPRQGTAGLLSPATEVIVPARQPSLYSLLPPGFSNHDLPFPCTFRPRRRKSPPVPARTLTQTSNSTCSPLDRPWF